MIDIKKRFEIGAIVQHKISKERGVITGIRDTVRGDLSMVEYSITTGFAIGQSPKYGGALHCELEEVDCENL